MQNLWRVIDCLSMTKISKIKKLINPIKKSVEIRQQDYNLLTLDRVYMQVLDTKNSVENGKLEMMDLTNNRFNELKQYIDLRFDGLKMVV